MRTFKEVVKSIKQSERDVDKVLKAAKLTRNPVSNLYEMYRLEAMLDAVIVLGVMAILTTIFIVAITH